MARKIVLAVMLLLCESAAFAQHHSQSTILDGSKNPELIADSHAQRHWLLLTAANPGNLNNLAEFDKFTALSIITDFKAQYLRMVTTYNQQAFESEKNGGRGDIAAFQAQIDSLVAQTLRELSNRLTPLAYRYVENNMKAHKTNVKRIVN